MKLQHNSQLAKKQVKPSKGFYGDFPPEGNIFFNFVLLKNWEKLRKVGKSWEKLEKVAKVAKSSKSLQKVAKVAKSLQKLTKSRKSWKGKVPKRSEKL